MEDQFNEIKAKDDQQTQLIHDLNMQKARLQTQNGEGSGRVRGVVFRALQCRGPRGRQAQS